MALICMMKKILAILITLIFFLNLTTKAQFSESKERKKMWRKSKNRHKKREAYNPYLDKKKKDKPSAQIAKEEKQGTRKMRRDYRRQQKRNMKKLGIKHTKVKKA